MTAFNEMLKLRELKARIEALTATVIEQKLLIDSLNVANRRAIVERDCYETKYRELKEKASEEL